MNAEDLKGKTILCPQCHGESKLNVKKRYEGLKVTGFDYVCSFCGMSFAEDAIPFIDGRKMRLKKEKEHKVCEECRHYAKNVWVQKCMLHGTRVMALDTCNQFAKRDKPAEL